MSQTSLHILSVRWQTSFTLHNTNTWWIHACKQQMHTFNAVRYAETAQVSMWRNAMVTQSVNKSCVCVVWSCNCLETSSCSWFIDDTLTTNGAVCLYQVVAWLSSKALVSKTLDQHSYSTSGPVNTLMGDGLWAGKPSRYVTSHLGLLSLPSL